MGVDDDEQLWEKIQDKDTQQWVWRHRLTGQCIVIHAPATNDSSSSSIKVAQAPRPAPLPAPDTIVAPSEQNTSACAMKGCSSPAIMLQSNGYCTRCNRVRKSGARRPSDPDGTTTITAGRETASVARFDPESEETDEVVSHMSASQLSGWLRAHAAAEPAACTAVLRRQIDGRALLAIMSDPFVDGLGDLGVRDPIARGRIAAAVARARRSELRETIARAHDAQRAADALTQAARRAPLAPLLSRAAPEAQKPAQVLARGQVQASDSQAFRGRRPMLHVTTASADARAKPLAVSPPTVVSVGYKVDTIGDIDCVRAVFFLNLKLYATWVDPLLANCSLQRAEELHVDEKRDVVLRWVQDHGLLQPDLEVVNPHEVETQLVSIRLSDRTEGRVKWSTKLSGWFDLELGLSLENFPYDFHDLRVAVRSTRLNKHQATLVLWPDTHAIDVACVAEWELIGHRVDILETDPSASIVGDVYSELHICIMMGRLHSWYINNVVFFLVAIDIVSLGIFFMPFASEDGVAGRVGCAVALIFAIIALKFVVMEHIPRVHYSTLFDEYVIACFFFVVASGIQSLIMFHLSPPGKADCEALFSDALCIANSLSAAVVVIAIIVFHLALWFRLNRHAKRRQSWAEMAMEQMNSNELQAHSPLQRSRSMNTSDNVDNITTHINQASTRKRDLRRGKDDG